MSTCSGKPSLLPKLQDDVLGPSWPFLGRVDAPIHLLRRAYSPTLPLDIVGLSQPFLGRVDLKSTRSGEPCLLLRPQDHVVAFSSNLWKGWMEYPLALASLMSHVAFGDPGPFLAFSREGRMNIHLLRRALLATLTSQTCGGPFQPFLERVDVPIHLLRQAYSPTLPLDLVGPSQLFLGRVD